MWLNRNITKEKTGISDLSRLLDRYISLDGLSLQTWMKLRFVQRFYGSKPHPFVVAMQKPSRATLLGYVLEHQHFLRQWVHSCAYIIAKTDKEDVVHYELDNINTEFGGFGPSRPSHYELLIRMGESLGLDRHTIMNTPPLRETKRALEVWDAVARESHWVETMAAMHGLELIADRNLRYEVKEATVSYFDPAILQKGNNQITDAAKDFLREGYEADVEHSENALKLVSKYSQELGLIEDVQATFLKSIDTFSGYLMARLERAEEFTD
jgi:pyrroloquinoline-quinone synthase